VDGVVVEAQEKNLQACLASGYCIRPEHFRQKRSVQRFALPGHDPPLTAGTFDGVFAGPPTHTRTIEDQKNCGKAYDPMQSGGDAMATRRRAGHWTEERAVA
jgi:hypothetical protein